MVCYNMYTYKHTHAHTHRRIETEMVIDICAGIEKGTDMYV